MPVSSSDEDIGGVPSMQSSYSARMKRCGCMEERSPLWVRRSKSEETIEQSIDNYGGIDFWYKKVLSRPRKADNESDERICWGREFQIWSPSMDCCIYSEFEYTDDN